MLPNDAPSAVQRAATARDVSVGHLVRQLLNREVARLFDGMRSGGSDDRLLAALNALLSRDLAEATSWENLAERLCRHGYALRLAGSGVDLRKVSCGTRICDGAGIGAEYKTLCLRFGGPMPSSSNGDLCAKMRPGGKLDAARHAALLGHVQKARNWADLVRCFASEGAALRPVGAGLGVFDCASGQRLCGLASLGVRYVTLVQRYGAALPNHPRDMSAFLEVAPKRATDQPN